MVLLNPFIQEVSREIQRALAKGCIAAAGNDVGPVGVPARYTVVLAVSAVGVRVLEAWLAEGAALSQ